MQRRLIAAIAAVILAGIGAILLFNYVATADARAMEGQQPTDVLVVTQPIEAGTLGSHLAGYVEKRQLPLTAIVPGALTSLDQVAALATTTDLAPGEQLITSRFAEPGTSADGEVAIPNDMQLVSIALEAQRTVGGQLAPGDKVAIYVTREEKTQQILQSVLVVKAGGEESGGTITLALAPANAQKVILATEASKIWLVKEAKNPSGTTPLDIKQLIR
jgi:pilus assembly protein CpaB